MSEINERLRELIDLTIADKLKKEPGVERLTKWASAITAVIGVIMSIVLLWNQVDVQRKQNALDERQIRLDRNEKYIQENNRINLIPYKVEGAYCANLPLPLSNDADDYARGLWDKYAACMSGEEGVEFADFPFDKRNTAQNYKERFNCLYFGEKARKPGAQLNGFKGPKLCKKQTDKKS